MSRIIKTYFKFFIFLFGISLLLVNCEKETIEVVNQQEIEHNNDLDFKLESLTLNQANDETTFLTLKTKFNIEEPVYNPIERKYFSKVRSSSSESFSSDGFSDLDPSIDVSVIKKITTENYISYTMRLNEPQNTSNSFSNIVIQENNGVQEIFTLKYTPTQSQSESSLSTNSFDGTYTMAGGIIPFDGWDEIDDGSGGGDDFVEICNDVSVIVIIPCGCGHTVPCSGSDCGPPTYAYYDLQTQQECYWDYIGNIGDTNPDPVNNNPSGITSDSDGNVITTMIFPEGALESLISNLNITDVNQINWINDIANIASANNIWVYGLTNNWSDEAVSLGTLAVKVLMDNSSLNFNSIVQIANNISNPCQANIVYESFLLNSTFTNTVKETLLVPTDKHVSVRDIVTTVFEGAATDYVRATTPDGDFVLIEFNTNYLNQATDLGIVMSLLHEMVHANIIHLYHEGQLLSVYPTYTDLQTAIDNHILINNNATKVIAEKEMHDIYVDFIDLLAESILQYCTDNNITGVDLAYSKKLAWGSLYGYDVFTDNLTASEQLEAQTAAAYEHHNHANAKAPKSCN